MKKDEQFLFKLVCACDYKFPLVSVREVVETLHNLGFIHYKRSLYLLRKWSDRGFYNYGVSLLSGWLEYDKLPQRYLDIIQNNTIEVSKNEKQM